MKLSKHQFMINLLNFFNEQDNGKYVLRSNIFGITGQQAGALENFLKKEFTVEEKAMADVALRELQERGLVQPMYRDLISRGEDLVISEAGRRALRDKCLDELDELLLSLDSDYDLIAMRYGAYEAALSKRTDWERQAASSLVELVTKTLHAIAPDDEVRAREGFVADKNSRSGITREMRIKFFLKKQNQGKLSKSTELVIREAHGLLDACLTRLQAIKHTDHKEFENLLKLTEDGLLYLLGN